MLLLKSLKTYLVKGKLLDLFRLLLLLEVLLNLLGRPLRATLAGRLPVCAGQTRCSGCLGLVASGRNKVCREAKE